MSDFPPPPPGQPGWGPSNQPRPDGWGPPSSGDFDAPNQGWPQAAAPLPQYVPTDHPDGTKALVISILSLLCCGPLAIWSLVLANKARSEGTSDGKITAAFVISIITLGFLALSVVMVLAGAAGPLLTM